MTERSSFPWSIAIPAGLALLGLGTCLAMRAASPPVSSSPKAPPAGPDTIFRGLITALGKHEAELGPATVEGNAILLFGGALRLSVEPRAHENPELLHAHVISEVGGSPSARLDACVVGVDKDSEAGVADWARTFVGLALPPIASYLPGGTHPRASAFHGTEPWGVAGRRGFVGAAGMRWGKDVEPFAKAPLFADVTSLQGFPSDDGPHLIKVTLDGHDGTWRRWVELDSDVKLAEGLPWKGLPPPASPVVVVRYAVVGGRDASSDEAARAAALAALGARPAWLFTAEVCPADVMTIGEHAYFEAACRGGRLRDCLRECEGGAPASCFMAGLEVGEPASEALFLRACRLGMPAGCTNAAAARVKAADRFDDCSFRTFEAGCEKARDPWSCTMLAGALVKGEPHPRDLPRARAVLVAACRNGPEDPACAQGRALLARIDAAGAGAPGGAGKDAGVHR